MREFSVAVPSKSRPGKLRPGLRLASAKPLGRFLCFAADGEPIVRDLIGIDIHGSFRYGHVWFRTGRDLVSYPLPREGIFLVLRSLDKKMFSFWDPQEVVPLDRKARVFMAKTIHRQLRTEFIDQRRAHRIRKPSLKVHAARIEELV